MKRNRSLKTAVCCTALLLLLAAPALAQTTIQQGIDAMQSSPGTLASVNVPADYFCPGSGPVNTIVSMQGVPLTTNPPHVLGLVDTVIERLKDATIPAGGCATIPAVVRAVSLESVPGQELIVFCPGVGNTQWKVTACTCGCCGVQPITDLTLCDDGSCADQTCGTFTGDLKLDICLSFENIDDWTVLGPVQDQVTLNVNTPWCENNPGGVVEYSDAVMIDTDCDGQANLGVPCTTNFFPGATCDGPGCPPPVCHPGPTHDHCVEQPCEQPCGNGVCDAGEDCNNCAADCPGGFASADADATNKMLEMPVEEELQPYCCGNAIREVSETVATCNGRV